jgi:hypothetical protein
VQHRRQAANEYVLHAVAVKAREQRFRLECGHVALLVANERTGRPGDSVDAQEHGVGLEPLFRCPGEALQDQAAVVSVGVVLLRKRGAQGVTSGDA